MNGTIGSFSGGYYKGPLLMNGTIGSFSGGYYKGPLKPIMVL